MACCLSRRGSSGFSCFQLYPILSALYYSFTDFNIFQPAEFTGLDNYVTLFNDKYFPVSIKNTAVMSFIGMPIGLVVALALAVLLSKEVKGMPAFRTIYYLPTVVPIVASAMLIFVGAQPGIRPAEQLFVLVRHPRPKLAERPEVHQDLADDYGRVALRAEHRQFSFRR